MTLTCSRTRALSDITKVFDSFGPSCSGIPQWQQQLILLAVRVKDTVLSYVYVCSHTECDCMSGELRYIPNSICGTRIGKTTSTVTVLETDLAQHYYWVLATQLTLSTGAPALMSH